MEMERDFSANWGLVKRVSLERHWPASEPLLAYWYGFEALAEQWVCERHLGWCFIAFYV